MPFFSIIIPTFNASSTVFEAIQSVLSQNFKDFEILIMDGESTDDTLKQIQSLDDNRIKVFSEKDSGVYDAMNKGIDKSTGEWLYFLGSDDTLYNQNVLLNVSSVLINTKDRIIYGNCLIRGNSSWAKDGEIYNGQFDLKKILSKNICHQSLFYSQEIFKKYGGYNLKYKILADYDFNLKLFAVEKFHYINIIIANFKMGGMSSLIDDLLFYEDMEDNIISYYKNLHQKEFKNFIYSFKKRGIKLLKSYNPMGLYFLALWYTRKILYK